ncbi:MAG: triose-phosphate isomerase, partial [Sphaerochaetaceae bacterium]
MREAFIAGNWKMNMTPAKGAEFATALVKELADCKSKVLVAPPFV